MYCPKFSLLFLIHVLYFRFLVRSFPSPLVFVRYSKINLAFHLFYLFSIHLILGWAFDCVRSLLLFFGKLIWTTMLSIFSVSFEDLSYVCIILLSPSYSRYSTLSQILGMWLDSLVITCFLALPRHRWIFLYGCAIQRVAKYRAKITQEC